jgi:hypothetical protein
VRSRQPSLRNAYRRASPNPRCPFELRVFRNLKSPRGEVISNFAHRFAFANLELSRQRDVRASLGLDAHLGFSKFSFEIPVLAAMRAANECHPLPDQLHPCSWFSWFCSKLILRPVPFGNVILRSRFRSQEDRCVSRRLRSLRRGNRFLRSRRILSRSLNSLRFSCFRHPPLRFDSIFSNGYRSSRPKVTCRFRGRIFG